MTRKKKSGVREVYENGVLVGWQTRARSRVDQVIEAFIPRPDDEIDEDRRRRASTKGSASQRRPTRGGWHAMFYAEAASFQTGSTRGKM
jgi:hypothetical protein